MSRTNALRKAKKTQVIKKHQIHNDDSGSVEVQIAVLTESIKHLTDHLKENPKDKHSTRGLLQKVGKRKSLLRYLKGKDTTRHTKVVTKHKLKTQ